MIRSSKILVLACVSAMSLGSALPPAAWSVEKHHSGRRATEKPIAGEAKAGERVTFDAAETETAWPEELPGRLRIPGDDAAAFHELIAGAGAAHDTWLVLSGGGENGAFAAGLLSGWSQTGSRPVFGVVTGVSTGALIAPFAFVGPAEDGALKRNYTEISAADVFEFGGTGAALTDTWPLRQRIDRSVTPDLLRKVAAEHAKGRRLLVATTQVETERPVVWDMGAIATIAAGPEAARYGDKALKLFREIILASTAVPGVFPPVMINALGADGKAFQEMHDDGGAMSPYFLAPAAALIEGRGESARLPASTVYLVINNRLTPEFGLAPRSVLGVLGRTMSAAIKAQMQGAVAIARSYAARTGLDLRVAEIDERFKAVSPGPFDGTYMKALFEHGEALGRSGTGFTGQQIASPAKSTPETGKADATAPLGGDGSYALR